MNAKRILLFDTVVAGIFGVALIVFPVALLSLLGMASNTDAEILLARLLGSALLGIGITECLARDMSVKGILPILRGLLCFDLLALGISLKATFSHTVNAIGWLVVALFLFFAIARVLLGFRKTYTAEAC